MIPRHRHHCAFAIALATGFAGCATTAPTDWETALERTIVDRASDFGNGARLLAGFDPSRAEDDLEVGDTLLYGIRLDVGDEHRIWFLRLRIEEKVERDVFSWRFVQPFETHVTTARRRAEAAQRATAPPAPVDLDVPYRPTPMARIRVEAFDGAGTSLGAAESTVSVQRLRTGLWSACVAGARQHDLLRGWDRPERAGEVLEVDEATYADVMTVAEGVAACESFFALLRQNPVTRQILFEVIALPSLWSIVTHLGVAAGFAIDFFGASPLAPGRIAPLGEEVWSVPMTIELNHQPALLVRLLAAPPRGPTITGAGVCGLVARHPRDPDRRVHVQLLACRSGRSQP